MSCISILRQDRGGGDGGGGGGGLHRTCGRIRTFLICT